MISAAARAHTSTPRGAGRAVIAIERHAMLVATNNVDRQETAEPASV